MLEEPKPEYWAHFQPPDTVPVEDGWYPVIRAFDPNDLAYPDAEEWRAGRWVTHSTHGVVIFGPRQETEAGALKAAVENEPGW